MKSVIALMVIMLVTPVMAASSKKKTKIDFDELLVQGKHHFADEAVITVENDKVLDALLKVRKDFKDRVKRSSALR